MSRFSYKRSNGDAAQLKCIQGAHLKQVRLRRLLSKIYDDLIILSLTFALLFFLGIGMWQVGERLLYSENIGGEVIRRVVFLSLGMTVFFSPLVGMFYCGWLMSKSHQATWGQRLYGLQTWRFIRSPLGEMLWRPSFSCAAMHSLLGDLSKRSFFPIFLLSFLVPRKRCLHDIATDIIILRDLSDFLPNPAAESVSPLPKRKATVSGISDISSS